ncbi:hypothetical protein CH380_18945 [Leptospira adleri]|uniref:Uncharacterized protein n=1 Tax=Leptospira adleri TaxID=2023186 RepID=A0A2M9YJL1_9LEPT|nr:hypothetical protein CH380_18945 [Leptospira adleri]PJZ62175.1 hypothetical protein CH376_09570 [Leptospira adleri]
MRKRFDSFSSYSQLPHCSMLFSSEVVVFLEKIYLHQEKSDSFQKWKEFSDRRSSIYETVFFFRRKGR